MISSLRGNGINRCARRVAGGASISDSFNTKSYIMPNIYEDGAAARACDVDINVKAERKIWGLAPYWKWEHRSY